jgi:septal ring factor EnvC (AmiA/AmiB activator)
MSKSLSPAMTAATNRERRRLEKYRERLVEQLQRARADVARLEAEVRAVDDQARALDRLVDGAGDQQGARPLYAGEVLRGARLREVAVRVLAARVGARKPVYYRDWFGWVQEEGFVVLGKRPHAAFLTAVSRSPVIKRGEDTGAYVLDPDALDALMQARQELRAEIADVDRVLERESEPTVGMLDHREGLRRQVRRLDVHIAEARDADEALRRRPLPLQAIKAA